MGHVKMMGAVQPFISGAISKTVNLPEEATVEDVSQLADRVVAARRQGDRDLPRQLQGRAAALRLGRQERRARSVAGRQSVAQPKRRRVPEDRVEVGRKFKVGDYEGYIHVGLFEDGTPGDIFVDIAKEGTTLAGLMNSFMISVGLGLQYGVPLEVYVSKFSPHALRAERAMTNDADIRVAKSIVDYIFRWMGKKFLTTEQQEEAGILTAEVKARLAAGVRDAGEASAPSQHEALPRGQTALFNNWEDAVECAKCGGRMVRTGSCYTCRDCGTNTGASWLQACVCLIHKGTRMSRDSQRAVRMGGPFVERDRTVRSRYPLEADVMMSGFRYAPRILTPAVPLKGRVEEKNRAACHCDRRRRERTNPS